MTVKQSDALKEFIREFRIKELNKIKELRDERGWSVEHLSEISNVSKGEVSMIENGQRVPNQLIIYRISRSFGLPAHEVFTI